jgi:hypothetical protein
VATFSIFNASPTPVTGTVFNDNEPVELGMAFTVINAGWITDLLYYRPQQGSNVAVTRELRLWRHSTKALLATAQATTPAGSFGWQKAKLATPIKIAASTRYIVSYRTNDWYQSANNYFNSTNEVAFDGRDDNAYSDPSGTVRAGQSSGSYANGVYAYGSAIVMPSQTHQKCNYWLDVVFTDQDPGVVTPPPALPVVTLAVSPATAAEDGTANLLYTFSRTGDTSFALTVNYTVSGTAASRSDFTGTSSTVTFAAGSATATVIIDPAADATVEPDETVTIALAAGAGYTLGTPGSATGTITNDDVVAPPPPSTGLKGWQLNETNTGLASFGINGSQLPVYTGPYEIPAGSFISGVRFTGNVSLWQGNITIEKSIFQPTDAGRGMPLVNTSNYNGNFESAKGKVVIRDCEFDGSLLSQETAAYATAFIGIADMQRNYIHHFGSGIALMNTGTQFDSIIEGNYAHKMLGFGNPNTTGNHSDTFTIRDFTDSARPDRKAIIRNNRFVNDSPNATGPFFMQAWNGRIDNVSIEGNLVEGNGWNMGLEANQNGYSNISVVNNRFNPAEPQYVVYYQGGPGWTTWQENYRYDPTKPDGKGAIVN